MLALQQTSDLVQGVPRLPMSAGIATNLFLYHQMATTKFTLQGKDPTIILFSPSLCVSSFFVSLGLFVVYLAPLLSLLQFL